MSKTKKILCIALTGAILLIGAVVILIKGYPSNLHSSELDPLLEEYISCLESGNSTYAYSLIYPYSMPLDEFYTDFQENREQWLSTFSESDTYSIQLTSIHYSSTTTSGNGTVKYVTGNYTISNKAERIEVSLTRCSYRGYSGLFAIEFTFPSDRSLFPDSATSGTFRTWQNSSGYQRSLLLFSVLCWVFMAVTLVDILRHRPAQYGLWCVIALAVIAVYFHLSLSQFNFRLLVYPAIAYAGTPGFLRYAEEACQFRSFLPVGAIVYWCMRKKLLAKKHSLQPEERDAGGSQ